MYCSPRAEPHAYIPVSFGARQPQYVIAAGLVFLAFSLPYFYEAMASGVAGGASGGSGASGSAGGRAKRTAEAAWAQITGTLEWGMPVHGENATCTRLVSMMHAHMHSPLQTAQHCQRQAPYFNCWIG